MNPRRQLETLSDRLHRAADNVPQTLTHLRQQQDALADLRARTYDGTRTGQRTITVRYIDDNGEEQIDHVPVTSVEAVAIQMSKLTYDEQTIRDYIASIELGVTHLERACIRSAGTQIETPTALCRDGGFGKKLSPLLGADIANCWEIPHKTGLCNAHYLRWWRERRDNGDNVRTMHEPGAA